VKSNEHTKASALVSDGNDIFLSGLAALVSTNARIEQICSAKNVIEIESCFQNINFELFVLDIDMPFFDAENFIRSVKAKSHSAKILILSSIDDILQIKRLFNVGAKGYLNKNSSKEEIPIAIETLFKGKFYVNDALKNSILQDPLGINNYTHLNSQYTEMIFLISHELSNKQIAQCLGLTVKTIEYHRAHLFEMLGISNMAGIGVYAVRNSIYFNVDLNKKYSKWINRKKKLMSA
jgi:DNA-binding NarL/FixJ family response regulator